MRICARVSSGLNLLMATERAATTPAKLKGRFKPQQFAPVSCTGDCLSHHSEESRLPQTLFHTDGAAHPLQGEDLVQRKFAMNDRYSDEHSIVKVIMMLGNMKLELC
jgi:hypothetical protein